MPHTDKSGATPEAYWDKIFALKDEISQLEKKKSEIYKDVIVPEEIEKLKKEKHNLLADIAGLEIDIKELKQKTKDDIIAEVKVDIVKLNTKRAELITEVENIRDYIFRINQVAKETKKAIDNSIKVKDKERELLSDKIKLLNNSAIKVEQETQTRKDKIQEERKNLDTELGFLKIKKDELDKKENFLNLQVKQLNEKLKEHTNKTQIDTEAIKSEQARMENKRIEFENKYVLLQKENEKKIADLLDIEANLSSKETKLKEKELELTKRKTDILKREEDLTINWEVYKKANQKLTWEKRKLNA